MKTANRSKPGHLLLEGKPVINADKTISISVRTTDIKHALGTAADACAIAIACVRQFDAVLSARVYPARTFLEYKDRWVRYSTGPALREQIVKLDTGEKFEPGIYSLMRSGYAGANPTGKAHGKPPRKSSRGKGKKRQSATWLHTARGRVHYGHDTPTTITVETK